MKAEVYQIQLGWLGLLLLLWLSVFRLTGLGPVFPQQINLLLI